MKNVIVAGANGFLGSALIERFMNEDVHIWALSRRNTENICANKNITWIEENSSMNSSDSFPQTVDFDLFYNFAWQGVNGPDKGNYAVQSNNILLTLHYAELARSLGCKKYLCAGTIAERAVESLDALRNVPAGMMYSAAKACSYIMLEAYCKNVGLDFVWMQIPNIYGPRNKTGNLISYTIEQLKKGEPATFGPAQQPYDFLYVDDLVEAIYRLGMRPTEHHSYYIGSGTPRILEEYLRAVGDIYGSPDLIHIGEREDDGIRYRYDMLDASSIFTTIGNYISDTFENHIKYTIDHY